ncbi:hypothetical protein RN001_005421 [Aquatica leii]|uniref:Gustatory receptor n=1 Tax=Aquatica leii TaxID=1421715 RepID=A0AAN7PBX3_9COLE|nr:hypothetical protein RN001_005421 [Aquatica leii]
MTKQFKLKNVFRFKRSSVTRKKDLYDAMLPIFVLSKILGLAPFRLDCKARRLIPHCGPMIAIRFFLIIGVMCYVAVLVYDPKASINIGWLALRFELCLGATITSVVLTLAVTNQKMLITAVENIIKIDKEMSKIGINITYVNAQRFCYFQILGISCVFSTKLILQAFSARKYYKFVYNVFNVVDYMNTIMLFQYVDILLLLRQRYIWLNREIKKMSQKPYVWNFMKTDKELYSIIHLSNYTNEESSFASAKMLIKRWGKLHGELSTTARLINRVYAFQLLCTICARFIMVTTQLINVYKSIQNPNQSDTNTISDNTAAKARDTGIYLHTLWDFNHFIKDEINFLSLQILHQNVHFTAAGFFTLDYALIHSIVGAVTTYLIIIIQFDVSRAS